jgi:hypothetical protein
MTDSTAHDKTECRSLNSLHCTAQCSSADCADWPSAGHSFVPCTWPDSADYLLSQCQLGTVGPEPKPD